MGDQQQIQGWGKWAVAISPFVCATDVCQCWLRSSACTVRSPAYQQELWPELSYHSGAQGVTTTTACLLFSPCHWIQMGQGRGRANISGTQPWFLEPHKISGFSQNSCQSAQHALTRWWAWSILLMHSTGKAGCNCTTTLLLDPRLWLIISPCKGIPSPCKSHCARKFNTQYCYKLLEFRNLEVRGISHFSDLLCILIAIQLNVFYWLGRLS